jgi:hypothetical protein
VGIVVTAALPAAEPDLRDALAVAKEAGLVGCKRVLDSTPLYDAVATQDTVTMIRAAIRGLLRVVDATLGTEIRAVLDRDDDDKDAGKPVCDWDDKERVRRWSRHWRRTDMQRCWSSTARTSGRRWHRLASYWPRYLGKTWRRPPMVALLSPGEWLPIA